MTQIPGDRRGYVTILMAGAMTMLIGAAALGVDMGSIYIAKRQLQGVADAAALSATSNIANPLPGASAAVTAGGTPNTTITGLVRGRYVRDPSLEASARFVVDSSTDAVGANAAKVTLIRAVFFLRMPKDSVSRSPPPNFKAMILTPS